MSKPRARKTANVRLLRRVADSVALRPASRNAMLAPKPLLSLASQLQRLANHSNGLHFNRLSSRLSATHLARIRFGANPILSRYARFNRRLNPLYQVWRTLQRPSTQPLAEQQPENFEDAVPTFQPDFEPFVSPNNPLTYNVTATQAKIASDVSSAAQFFEPEPELFAPLIPVSYIGNKLNKFKPVTQTANPLQRALLEPRQIQNSFASLPDASVAPQPASDIYTPLSPLEYRKSGQNFDTESEIAQPSPNNISRPPATANYIGRETYTPITSANNQANSNSPFFVAPAPIYRNNPPVPTATVARNYNQNISNAASNSNFARDTADLNRGVVPDQPPFEYGTPSISTQLNRSPLATHPISERASALLVSKQPSIRPPLSISARAFVTNAVFDNSNFVSDSVGQAAPFIQRNFASAAPLLDNALAHPSMSYARPTLRPEAVTATPATVPQYEIARDFAAPVSLTQPTVARNFAAPDRTASSLSASITPSSAIRNVASNSVPLASTASLDYTQSANFAYPVSSPGRFIFNPVVPGLAQTISPTSFSSAPVFRLAGEPPLPAQVSRPVTYFPGETGESQATDAAWQPSNYIFRQPNVSQNSGLTSQTPTNVYRETAVAQNFGSSLQSPTNFYSEAAGTQIANPIAHPSANIYRMFVEPNLTNLADPYILADRAASYSNTTPQLDPVNLLERALQTQLVGTINSRYRGFLNDKSQTGTVNTDFTPLIMRFGSAPADTLHNETANSQTLPQSQAGSNFLNRDYVVASPPNATGTRAATPNNSVQFYPVAKTTATDVLPYSPGQLSRPNSGSATNPLANSNSSLQRTIDLRESLNQPYPRAFDLPDNLSQRYQFTPASNPDLGSVEADKRQRAELANQSVIFAPAMVWRQLQTPANVTEAIPAANDSKNLGLNAAVASQSTSFEPHTNNLSFQNAAARFMSPPALAARNSIERDISRPNIGIFEKLPANNSSARFEQSEESSNYSPLPLIMRNAQENQTAQNSSTAQPVTTLPVKPVYPPLPLDVLRADIAPLNSLGQVSHTSPNPGKQTLATTLPTRFTLDQTYTSQAGLNKTGSDRPIMASNSPFQPFAAGKQNYPALSDSNQAYSQSPGVISRDYLQPETNNIFAPGIIWRQLQVANEVASPVDRSLPGQIALPKLSPTYNLANRENSSQPEEVGARFIKSQNNDVAYKTSPIIEPIGYPIQNPLNRVGSISNKTALQLQNAINRVGEVPAKTALQTQAQNSINRFVDKTALQLQNLVYRASNNSDKTALQPQSVINRVSHIPGKTLAQSNKMSGEGKTTANLEKSIGTLKSFQPLLERTLSLSQPLSILARTLLSQAATDTLDIANFQAADVWGRDTAMNYAAPPLMTRKAQAPAPTNFVNRNFDFANDLAVEPAAYNNAQAVALPIRFGNPNLSNIHQLDRTLAPNYFTPTTPLAATRMAADQPMFTFAKPKNVAMPDVASQPGRDAPLPAMTQRTGNYPTATSSAASQTTPATSNMAYTQSADLSVASQPLAFIQRKPTTPSPLSVTKTGLDMASSVLRTSVGKPLERETHTQMSSIFQRNFENVRVHDSPQAANYAAQIGAEAFTIGPNIFFGADRYKPQTQIGRALLGHELTHVVQQANLPSLGNGRTLETSTQGHAFEHEAIQNEKKIFQHLENNHAASTAATPLQRIVAPSNFQSAALTTDNFAPVSHTHIQREIATPPTPVKPNQTWTEPTSTVQRFVPPTSQDNNVSENAKNEENKPDIEALAQQVLRLLRHEMLVERERKGIISNNWF